MPVQIPSVILAKIQSDARAAFPKEMCGLLFGTDVAITSYRQTANVAADPACRFEIDPGELILAEKAMRSGGPQLIGAVHSHPTGKVEPSATDAEQAAADGRFWLIVNGEEATLWRADETGVQHGRFTRLSLEQIG